MQESGLTEIIPLICASAICGGHPVYFTSWASLGLTLGSGCHLTAVRRRVFFSYLSSLRAHQPILEGCNCWWLWHPSGEENGTPLPVLLPGKSHGQRSLVGCSRWGRKESDVTERLHFHFSLSRTGERNGNSLQCSCLENPRDSGVWWAAVYGVAQSRTQLKWLSNDTLLYWYSRKYSISHLQP